MRKKNTDRQTSFDLRQTMAWHPTWHRDAHKPVAVVSTEPKTVGQKTSFRACDPRGATSKQSEETLPSAEIQE